MDNKRHDSRAIANYYVKKAMERGDRLTILPLVKYVYLAHGWTLGWLKRPLISHKVEAWRFGPVVPETYNAFRPQGFTISEPVEGYEANLDNSERDIMDNVYDAYSVLKAFEISDLTHGPSSPWYPYRHRSPAAEIPELAIQEHYAKAVERIRSRNEQT